MNDERLSNLSVVASILKLKPPGTRLKYLVKPEQTSTRKAKHSWKKIFDRRALKRSLSFEPSPML